MIPRTAIDRSSIWTLLAGTTLWLSLSVAACGGACPPIQHDDVFPLDLLRDASVSSDAAPDGADAADASATSDAAATRDGAASSRPPDASPAPDGSAPPLRLNCGSLAAGCTPGQSCQAACDCVLIRQRTGMNPMAVIDQCTLFAGAGPPSVEVRSHVRVDCE